MRNSISYILIFILLAGVSFSFVSYQLNNIEVDTFQFSITLSAEKEDSLTLFHRSQKQIYSKERKIKRKIDGDYSLHTFDYQLPAGTTNIRIDLSQNQEQKQLTINNITIKDTKGNSKILSNQQLQLLRFNPYCYGFVQIDQGLRFKTKAIYPHYAPQIDDFNIPYQLYYSR